MGIMEEEKEKLMLMRHGWYILRGRRRQSKKRQRDKNKEGKRLWSIGAEVMRFTWSGYNQQTRTEVEVNKKQQSMSRQKELHIIYVCLCGRKIRQREHTTPQVKLN
jgi:hypothetical protein